MKALFFNLSLILILVSSAKAYYAATPELPALGVDPNTITVSGLSSGAFFAVQFATAHSSKIQGVASLAGGIYNCAEGDALRASKNCMKEPQSIDVNKSLEFLRGQSRAGFVDDPAFIRRQKIFVYQGQKDSIVHPAAADKLIEFYNALGAQVQSNLNVPSGHGFPTEQVSAPCEANQKPWLNNCAYDGAGEILRSLYGSLQLSRPAKRQNLLIFDQGAFDTLDASMESEGFIYVPEVCQKSGARCRLHVVFHGCQQSPGKVGDQFITLAGYNEWAEANGLIVLYPSASPAKLNPNGCWDWFGYTGKDYTLRHGKQITVIHKMIERLKENPVAK
ncbi:Esterase PHB depolymerase [compost metagenome]